MKTLNISLIVFALTATVDVYAKGPNQCADVFYKGFAPIVSNKKLSKNIQNICYQKYALMYSGVSKTAIWSAEYVTPETLVAAKGVKRQDDFHEEPRVPVKFRSLLSDYRGSGYDRGHLVPSATRSTRTDQRESFSLANQIPQAPKNNQDTWRMIEEATRTIITKNKQPAYMITGPLFLSSSVKKIGSGVLVPTHIYKVVYYPNMNVMSAYVSVNDDHAYTEVVSVAELQSKSGLVFFPVLQGAPILQQRLNLPLSANAAYRQKSILPVSGYTTVFDVMPDPNALPSQKNKNSNLKDQAKERIVNRIQKISKDDVKNITTIFN